MKLEMGFVRGDIAVVAITSSENRAVPFPATLENAMRQPDG